MNKNHTYGLVGVQNGAPEMLFAWRNYKWKYICGEQKRFSSCNCSCVTSPSAEKSLFVKNIIHFPLKNSLLLQLIFCFFFFKPAFGFLMNLLCTSGHRMGEREHDRVITQTHWLWQKARMKFKQSCFQINTAKLSSSTCLFLPTSCFLPKMI